MNARPATPHSPALAGAIAASLVAFLLGCDASTGLARPDAPRPRLVVFAPAITSMVFELGLGDHVVGVDQYSRPPPGEERLVVGSALAVRVEPILAVEPDVLLVNMDVRMFEPVRLLRPELRIEHFDLFLLEDVARAMERIGEIAGRDGRGREAALDFRGKLEEVRRRAEGLPRPRTIFILGYEAPYGPGRGDFVDELIDVAGGNNVLAGRHDGWKPVSLEAVVGAEPEIVICQCDDSDREEARRYWGEASRPAGRGRAPRVVILTDPRWTQPGGHLADYAARLFAIIHAEDAQEEVGGEEGIRAEGRGP